jgi:hypothetical protein
MRLFLFPVLHKLLRKEPVITTTNGDIAANVWRVRRNQNDLAQNKQPKPWFDHLVKKIF